MIDLRAIVQEVKASLSGEQIRAKVVRDLNLVECKGRKYVCFLHHDDSKNPNMSYDMDRYRFHCFRCGSNYDLFDHYMQFYNLGFVEAIKQMIEDFGLAITMPLLDQSPKKVKPTTYSEPRGGVRDYIKLRCIGEETIKYTGLKQDGSNIIFEYRDAYGIHLANKYRPARKINKGENKNWWQGSANNALYNMDKVDISKPLVISEGEFDCLSLIEAGYKNAVSVPAGAKSCSWIEANWDWLMQFEEIILWFDNDNAGKEGVQLVANRLDNCSKVVYCTRANDINELLYRFGKNEVINQLNQAVTLDVEGVLTVSRIENFNVHEAEKIKTRIRIIDASIMGFVMGSLVITTGYNGSGKSTLINQICIAESISQGYKVFVFSGELTPSNFKSWLYQTLVDEADLRECKSVFNQIYHKPTKHAEDQITEWLDDKLFLYNKMDYRQDALLATMTQLAKRKGVRVFVLDNLMKVDLTENRNELLAQKKFVNELKMFALRYNCIIHLIAHPRKPQQGEQALNKFDVAGSGDITNLADYVIGIHRTSKEEAEEYEAQTAKEKVVIDPRDACLTLFKDRPTGSPEKKAALYFSRERRRFYSTEDELDYKYGYNHQGEQAVLDELFPF